MTMTIASPVFRHEGAIPARHTCEGEDVSPPLVFAGVPAEAKSLALIIDDPDAPDPNAPKRVWVHWVVYNLAPTTRELPEGVGANVPIAGMRVGKNDWGRAEYGGPCPPIGRHRYFHKLYALDTTLADLDQPDKATLEQAMQGHIVEQAVLMGTYRKASGG